MNGGNRFASGPNATYSDIQKINTTLTSVQSQISDTSGNTTSNTTQINVLSNQVNNTIVPTVNQHTTDISGAKTNISQNTSDISQNKSDISQNKNDISTTKNNLDLTNYNVNAQQGQISTISGNVTVLQAQVTTLTGAVVVDTVNKSITAGQVKCSSIVDSGGLTCGGVSCTTIQSTGSATFGGVTSTGTINAGSNQLNCGTIVSSGALNCAGINNGAANTNIGVTYLNEKKFFLRGYPGFEHYLTWDSTTGASALFGRDTGILGLTNPSLLNVVKWNTTGVQITGSLSASAGLVPRWNSGWYFNNNTTYASTTFTHALNWTFPNAPAFRMFACVDSPQSSGTPPVFGTNMIMEIHPSFGTYGAGYLYPTYVYHINGNVIQVQFGALPFGSTYSNGGYGKAWWYIIAV